MDIIINIAINLICGLMGYYFHSLLDNHKDRKRKEREQIEKDRQDAIEKAESERKSAELKHMFNNLDYSDKYNVVILAYGNPTFSSDDITLDRKKGESFYYPIPEGPTKKILASNKFNFRQSGNGFKYTDENNCLSPKFSPIILHYINNGLNCFGTTLESCKLELEEIAKEVADDFLAKLQAGKVRFNGSMFGVSFFDPGRTQEDETPTVTISYYTTDYFTFRVFAKYFLKHRQEFFSKYLDSNTNIYNIPINRIAFPFLSSFGVACLIIVSTHDAEKHFQNDDLMLFGLRSNDVEVDKGLVHFTMNEAFSLRDTQQGGTPDFRICLDRGLKEENGLIKDRIKGATFGDYHFLDFMLDANKCEMGVCCYVKVILDTQITSAEEFSKDFYEKYKTAQDGRLETTGFVMKSLDELENYKAECERDDIKTPKMSAGLKMALDMFNYRFKQGHI